MSAESDRFAALQKQADAGVAAEKAKMNAVGANAQSGVKGVTQYFGPYAALANKAYEGFVWVGETFFSGGDLDSEEQHQRAFAALNRYLTYGRPFPTPGPGLVGDVVSWSGYADQMETGAARFDALPDEQKQAALWLGQQLAAFGDSEDVAALVSAGGRWTMSMLPGAPRNDAGKQPSGTSFPFEPLIAGLLAAKATHNDVEAVTKDALAAWDASYAGLSDEDKAIFESPNLSPRKGSVFSGPPDAYARWGATALAAQQSAAIQRPMRLTLLRRNGAMNLPAQGNLRADMLAHSSPNAVAGPASATSTTTPAATSPAIKLLLLGGAATGAFFLLKHLKKRTRKK